VPQKPFFIENLQKVNKSYGLKPEKKEIVAMILFHLNNLG